MIAHIGGVPGEELIPDSRRHRLYICSRPRPGAGHSSVDFTLDRYGHLFEDAEDDIPERLDDLFNAHAAGQARAKKSCFR